MSELYLKRKLFTRLLPRLFDEIITSGKNPLLGKDGLKHMTGSLHFEGLAVDIDLFDESDHYLPDTESHRPFGLFWKSLHPDCRWGGDFKIPDGNHYSIQFQGRQ